MSLTGDRSSQNPPAPEEEPPRKQPTRRLRLDLCSSTRTRGNDAALQAAWGAICRPEEYVRPGEREEADIAEARNRGRGKAAQKERLKREWERLERAHEEAEARRNDAMEVLQGLSSLEVSTPALQPPQPPQPPQPLPAPTKGL